ncbi:DNA adenine methylase [Echinicola strongylocentroti]|uniref:DNA adenine methylase n=1 Tax=Echinicola strongylocentroti TaxID=1795355 RepID=A0A2Z4IMP3_9BACT|nr:DNA adenine methylase [Echinicola strongylocentroti]AWW31866.1 DNA adenine methylase [Echinicola strongylocentroti]
MAKLKTLTPYYGGKFNKVGKFISQILPVHRHYVEPCGGMAGVMMQKDPSFCEVYNDIDDNLVTLFEVVRDPESVKELSRRLDLTPYSREEWKRCRQTFRTEEEKIERARQIYVVLSMGYLGSMGNKSFNYGGTKYESSVARTFFNGLESLPAIHRRIKNIIIENQDCMVVAKKWDSKDTCFYWDTPYLKDTRVNFNDYANEMTNEQHQEVLDFVTSCKGKVIMSGYFHPIYEEALEPNGFQRIDLETYSRGSRSNGKGYDSKRTECIWLNYKTKDFSNPLFACLQSQA